MNADKIRFRRIMEITNTIRTFLMAVIIPFLFACAASTDWNNPCDHESSGYNAVECAKKQQDQGSQCEWCGRVVDDQNGTPLLGARIVLGGSMDTRINGRELYISETDGRGCIDFSFDTSSIAYSVTVTMDGYQEYFSGQTWGCQPGEKEIRMSPLSSGAPQSPSVLTAYGGSLSSQVDLVWQDNSNNEDGFKIERKTGSGGTYVQIGTVVVNVTTYQDTGLTCETEYYYRVRAYDGAVDSNYSSEANVTTGTCGGTVPTAPSGLTAAVVQDTEITLLWADNSDNETGFAVWRKTGTGGYSLIITTGPDVVSIVDGGLTPLTTYSYRVFAVNGAGSSTGYSEASTTTLALGVSASMASISAGCFNMGDAFGEGRANESPVHNVCLSAFKMNVYEVTNAQYKACVDAASCTAPGDSSSNTRSSYYGNATYDNYPVIYVDWDQSKSFCQWTGGRLPTEAEWEYAARGGLSGKRYPWGDNGPTCTLGATNGVQNGMCSPQDTIAVGSFAPNGYGLYDMAGNVWEWVNDWYSDTYYSSSPTQDPQGPSSGSVRVLRGGCWGITDPFNIRASVRGSNVQTYDWKYYGFRCVR